MEFLNGVTTDEIARKKVDVILIGDAEELDAISAFAFLDGGKLSIDCVPALNRKYVIELPEDAILSKGPTAEGFRYAILVRPGSDAGRFIIELLTAKIVGLN